jgi:hypothetical protein
MAAPAGLQIVIAVIQQTRYDPHIGETLLSTPVLFALHPAVRRPFIQKS